MKTFGDEARDLSYEISERELDLRLLTEFQAKGGGSASLSPATTLMITSGTSSREWDMTSSCSRRS